MSLTNRLRKLEVAGRPLPLVFVTHLPEEDECPEPRNLLNFKDYIR